MNVNISPNNSKMGKIPSISLPPTMSCDPKAPCQRDGCYALKSCYKRWKVVKNAWDNNMLFWQKDPDGFFYEIGLWLARYEQRCKKKGVKPYFRWHVGGDFPNQDYVDRVIKIAYQFPHIRFMAFTKRYNFFYPKDLPKNLVIRFSTWPHYPIPQKIRDNQPLSITDDGTEIREFKNTVPCKGACDKCYVCWSDKFNVVGKKH